MMSCVIASLRVVSIQGRLLTGRLVPHLLRRYVVVNSLLETFAYALGGYGLQVRGSEDVVDDGSIGRELLGGD